MGPDPKLFVNLRSYGGFVVVQGTLEMDRTTQPKIGLIYVCHSEIRFARFTKLEKLTLSQLNQIRYRLLSVLSRNLP
jgi:hypothetical protein